MVILYCAEIPLLNGCAGYGETADEALKNLREVKRTIIDWMMEEGKPIPEPIEEAAIAIPISLERKLKRLAKQRKLSFNDHIVEKLNEDTNQS